VARNWIAIALKTQVGLAWVTCPKTKTRSGVLTINSAHFAWIITVGRGCVLIEIGDSSKLVKILDAAAIKEIEQADSEQVNCAPLEVQYVAKDITKIVEKDIATFKATELRLSGGKSANSLLDRPNSSHCVK